MLFNFLSPPNVGGEYRGGFLKIPLVEGWRAQRDGVVSFSIASGQGVIIHEIEHLAIEFDDYKAGRSF